MVERIEFFIRKPYKTVKAWHLFNKYDYHQFVFYPKIVRIHNQLCYISGCKTTSKKGKNDFLIMVSFKNPEKALELYKERWQIEMCFKAMKSSGFNIESTHLTDIKRIQKLLLLIMIAFVWAYKVGIYLHQRKPIKIKTHGRKAKSIFKYGLDYIAAILLNHVNKDKVGIFKFFSCT